MAGGIGRPGQRLGDRRRESSADARPAPAEQACPARHCWVSGTGGPGDGWPGLLVEWRQVEGRGSTGRWEGRVVYAALLEDSRWVLVEEWLAAEVLTSR